MNAESAQLLRNGLDAYLARIDGGGLDPSVNYLPYDFDQIDSHPWRLLGGEMVKDELREITNILNHWQGALRRWHAWNAVVGAYGEDAAWELRREFLESLVHQCLLQPSAARDSLTFTATNSIHQARLAGGGGYRDYLRGDPEKPGDRPMHLTRRKKEERLAELIAPWHEGKEFLDLLQQIDDASYREATFDYRNRSSHAIGPRLAIGFTRAVVRSVGPVTEMVQQADGAYEPVQIPGKMAAGYGFGGTPPLDMEETRIANLDQYHHTRRCFERYRRLLAAAMSAIPPADSGA